MNLFSFLISSGKVSAQEFRSLLQTIENVQLIDVRTMLEIKQGHIPKAKFNNFFSANFRKNIAKLNRSAPVFVYCRSGSRSGKASRILKKAGFDEVYDLAGGFIRWQAKDFERKL